MMRTARVLAREDGVAIVVAVMAMLLMLALGMALVLVTSSESMIAGNFRSGDEGLHAADAGLERAMADLATVPDWNAPLNGSVQSTFIDGAPGGSRTLPDGGTLVLAEVVNMASCEKAAACSAADLTAVTVERPWGANNPVWQLYAYGPLKNLLPSATIRSPYYVVVMVGDDPSENDGNPLVDGASPSNPGAGVLALRAEAFGPRGVHKIIELTVVRGDAGVRTLSWREVR